jgi:hypothetical protein
MTPFDYIKAISESKQNLMIGTDNDELAEKDYEPFIVNRGLSFFPDTILYVNEMNTRASLDKIPQFLFLLNSIRPRKRYSKWLKKEKLEDVQIVSEYYGYSLAKSKEALKVLTQEQIKIMKTALEKGGVNTKEKKDARKLC